MLQLLDGEAPELDTAEIVGHGYLDPTRYQLALIHGLKFEDYGLWRAMQDVAFEQRARQYEALERLGTLVNAEPGANARYEAAIDECLDELGWLDGD